MKKTKLSPDSLIVHIESKFKEKSKIEGHLTTTPIDLGNKTYGVDIFTVAISGVKNPRLLLKGIYMTGMVDLFDRLQIFIRQEFGTYIYISKQDSIIWPIDIKDIKDSVTSYLNQLPELNIEIDGVSNTFTTKAQKEAFFRQFNNVINQNFLEFMTEEDTPILSDTLDCSFVPFNNGVACVSKDSIELKRYENFEGFVIWRDSIVDHNIAIQRNQVSHFQRFIHNVCAEDEDRIKAMKTGIGYLLHGYQPSSKGQMVVLYDESISDLDNPEGGTGKGVIGKAITQLRKVVKLDGKKFSGTDKFLFQEVDVDTDIVWIDDANRDFDIDRLNSVVTDGINVERKFDRSFHIPHGQSPKFMICSNITMPSQGSTRKRRQFILELAPFYSNRIVLGTEEPIIDVHGCEFFSKDWDSEEWNCFYLCMLEFIKLYLERGLSSVEPVNLSENYSRQQLGDDFYSWAEKKDFKPDGEYITRDLFKEYKNIYEPENSTFHQRSFSNKLKKYFMLKGQKVEFDTVSIDGEKISFCRIRNKD